MEIQEIKQQLTLAEVIKHYGFKADKYNRILCPFHPDKTPSMQLYWKTHTCYCFSSNCPTNSKSLDVIDFIMWMEKCTKHEAILKAQAMISGSTEILTPPEPLTKIAVLTKMFTYFKNAVHNSPPAKQYIQSRALDHTKTEIGYNSGQFHHGERRDEALIKSCLQFGLLSVNDRAGRTGDTAYKPFGKWCIVFALRNKQHHITGLYFRSTLNDKEQRHFYLKDREGLYPGYPTKDTKKLIITESIIDTATLLQFPEITSHCNLLALYGTNGLTGEHITAIKELKELDEIIFFLNGDEAGREAVKKHSETLHKLLPHIAISNTEPPQGEDVNSLQQGHTPEIFTHLLEKRIIIFSIEKIKSLSTEKKNQFSENGTASATQQTKQNILNTENPHNIHYKGEAAHYYIKGGVRNQLDALKVSLQIIEPKSRQDYRSKADLYEYKQVGNITAAAADKLGIKAELLQKDFSMLTHLLESYRNEQIQQQGNTEKKAAVKIPETTIHQCLDFLKAPKLLQRINQLIGKTGVTGEETNRLLLFTVAGSYKMPDTLHALIQGTSGSGKTQLLKIICELMPPEDTIRFTRVTDNSFYNYREDYLVHKLLGFEDIDGLKEDALYAVRELISNEILVSSTSAKTEDGQIIAMERTVRGPIASISCTTRGEIYEDNMSRVFLIAVDESKEQTKRIIQYQQQRASGQTDAKKEKQVREFLQHCIRLLKPYEVINPYARKIHLPEEAHKIRRLNDLYLSFVKQITLIHQYQRSKDKQGRLISAKEDLQLANDILFESILLKIDELDGSLRQFYEQLKNHVKKNEDDFILREVRQEMKISKTQLHRFISDLLQLEYIQQTSGYANRGYKYKITYWDDITALRERIHNHLQEQIDKLPENSLAFQTNGTPIGTPEHL